MAQSMLSPTMGRAYARMPGAFPLTAQSRPFTAAGAYSKVALLFGVATATGLVGWAVDSAGLGVVCLVAALVAALVGTFRPSLAPVTAPIYAATEGVVLGWVSAAYAQLGGGVVPVSIVFTAVVFLAAVLAFRSGLVRVTPRFVAMTMMATLGLAVVYLAGLLGMPIPGLNQLGPKGVLFGVVGLVIAVMNLFVDFRVIQSLERGAVVGFRGQALMSSAGEWYAAQSLMISLVLVYLNVLRIVAAATGNGRRR